MELNESPIMSEEEREKCRKVMYAFAELYDIADLIVLEAGKYGFVKLQYYNDCYGFDEVKSIFDSKDMFEDLWEEWYAAYLLSWAKGTEKVELTYEEMYELLPEENKIELDQKRVYFAEKAGVEII